MADVDVSMGGPVATCRIDSPATRNALSPALLASIADSLESLAADEEVRCVVLAGSEEVFATGEVVRDSGDDALALEADAWRRLGSIEKPVVAAVSGWALGSGFELALTCDLIVAGKTARFGLPDISLGVIPSGGATQRLTRALGRQVASELVLTGRRIEADEARRYGLVNSVVDKRLWLERAMRVAEGIAAAPPLAMHQAKQAILAAEREGLEAGLGRERELFELTLRSADHAEAVEALREKRPPRFTGR